MRKTSPRRSFFELYRNQRWPEIENYRAYLARMAWRIAIRRKRGLDHDELNNQQPSPGQIPETQAIEDQTRRWLHSQIGKLSTIYSSADAVDGRKVEITLLAKPLETK